MYVNIIFAVTGIVGALALEHSTHPDKPRLSLPSTISGSAVLFGIVFGASKAETNGWSSGITIGSLVAGAVLLAAFVLLQKYDRHPLIPLRVSSTATGAAPTSLSACRTSRCSPSSSSLPTTSRQSWATDRSPPGSPSCRSRRDRRHRRRHPGEAGEAPDCPGTRRDRTCHLGRRGRPSRRRPALARSYAALPLPALILLGVGLGLSVVVATSIGQQGVDPETPAPPGR